MAGWRGRAAAVCSAAALAGGCGRGTLGYLPQPGPGRRALPRLRLLGRPAGGDRLAASRLHRAVGHRRCGRDRRLRDRRRISVRAGLCHDVAELDGRPGDGRRDLERRLLRMAGRHWRRPHVECDIRDRCAGRSDRPGSSDGDSGRECGVADGVRRRRGSCRRPAAVNCAADRSGRCRGAASPRCGSGCRSRAGAPRGTCPAVRAPAR